MDPDGRRLIEARGVEGDRGLRERVVVAARVAGHEAIEDHAALGQLGRDALHIARRRGWGRGRDDATGRHEKRDETEGQVGAPTGQHTRREHQAGGFILSFDSYR